MDPRPWHEEFTSKTKSVDELSYWGTNFEQDLIDIVMKEEEPTIE